MLSQRSSSTDPLASRSFAGDEALDAHGSTRSRLIEAAGTVFAERGFKDATIRQICSIAGANIAAVNYHFGDKEHLYASALHHAHTTARHRHPMDFEGCGTAEERLGVFVRTFVTRLTDPAKPEWHGKLCAREMADPTGALDGLVERSIRPDWQALSETCGDLLGEHAPKDLIQRCAVGVIGQCLVYHHARPVMERLGGPVSFTRERIDAIVEQICAYSISGMRELGRRSDAAPSRRTPA
ncbi:MAG: CerR family C-terminal domain-containing protein [Phycisphaerales bacterium]